jgi:hypothetical protein
MREWTETERNAVVQVMKAEYQRITHSPVAPTNLFDILPYMANAALAYLHESMRAELARLAQERDEARQEADARWDCEATPRCGICMYCLAGRVNALDDQTEALAQERDQAIAERPYCETMFVGSPCGETATHCLCDACFRAALEQEAGRLTTALNDVESLRIKAGAGSTDVLLWVEVGKIIRRPGIFESVSKIRNAALSAGPAEGEK